MESGEKWLLTESGALLLADGSAVQASRQWLWSLSGTKLLVEFPEIEPRPYHVINMKPTDHGWQGKANHLCIDDTYDGKYVVGANTMTVSHKIKGPKKDYEIISQFVRSPE